MGLRGDGFCQDTRLNFPLILLLSLIMTTNKLFYIELIGKTHGVSVTEKFQSTSNAKTRSKDQSLASHFNEEKCKLSCKKPAYLPCDTFNTDSLLSTRTHTYLY